MKRLLTFTVLLVMALGGLALATETRVNTMGDANMIIKDDYNMFAFPSTINYYPRLFAAEFGENKTFYLKDGDDYDVFLNKVGANFQFGQKSDKPWVLGLYFDQRYYIPDILYDYVIDKNAGESGWATDHRITMLYGRELNGIPFGFIFSYYNMGQKVDNDTIYYEDEYYNYNQSLTRYEFSFGLSPMQKKLDLALKVGFSSWTDEYAYDETVGMVDNSKPSGNMDFALTGRYWMDPMGKYTLVPHAGIEYSKQGIELYEVDEGTNELYEEVTYKYTAFNLGCGLNYDATENVLVVADMGVSYEIWKDKYDYPGSDSEPYEPKWTDMMLPYFKVGIDAYAFKWMNVRAGVLAEWYRGKYEPYDSRMSKSSYVYTQTFLGAGFHWGNFILDANIDPDFLSRGPYFISGSNSGYYDDPYDLSSQISLKYMLD